MTGKELQSLLSHDRVIGEEVMKYAVVAWRPGSSDGDAAGRHCGQRGGARERLYNASKTQPKKTRATSCKYPY